jgi:hypothetical protein
VLVPLVGGVIAVINDITIAKPRGQHVGNQAALGGRGAAGRSPRLGKPLVRSTKLCRNFSYEGRPSHAGGRTHSRCVSSTT